jgi:hypothetical protein
MRTTITVVGRCEKKHWSQSFCANAKDFRFVFAASSQTSSFQGSTTFVTSKLLHPILLLDPWRHPRLDDHSRSESSRRERERERGSERERETELELSSVVGFVCCEEVGFWPKRRGQSVDGKKWRSFCGHHYPPNPHSFLFFCCFFFLGRSKFISSPPPLFLVTPRFHYLGFVHT